MNFNIQENEGVLDIIIGTMFSGKTSYLLGQIAKMAELNYRILYVNIEFDTRSDNYFSTHNPFFDNHVDFIKKESIKNNVHMCKSRTLSNIDISSYNIVIIDEAHFFDDLIEFTNKALELKKYIIVAGLQADFKGHKFGKILDLIPISTNITRLHAYCSECAKNKMCRIAIYSKKITKSKKINDVGGSDKYIPVCREHYFEQTNETSIQDKIEKVDKPEKTEKIEKIEKIEKLVEKSKSKKSSETDSDEVVKDKELVK